MPEIVLSKGSYRIPGPDLIRRDALDSKAKQCYFYTPDKCISHKAKWRYCTLPSRAKRLTLIDAAKWILSGNIILLEGELYDIADFSDEIERIIVGMGIAERERWNALARCVLRFVNGRLSGVKSEPVQFRYTPYMLQQIINDSHEKHTYAPTYIAYMPTRDVMGLLPYSEWLRRRFVKSGKNILQRAIGTKIHIEPKVFVPDPIVIDLFVSAYLDPSSPFPNDLKNKTVLEPCTGSGILAILAAKCGHARVIASDIDQGSVQCAQANARRLGLGKLINVMHADGIPANARGDLCLVNPPWFGAIAQAGSSAPDHYRRCLEDVNHRLLLQLLKQASRQVTGPMYIFVGEDDPFENPDFLADLPWRKDRNWLGFRHLQLHRLIKD